MFKTFEEVLSFIAQDNSHTSSKIILTDAPAVVEREWSDGTPASGYSAGSHLVSLGMKTALTHSGGDMPSGNDRFRGEPQMGFMVLERRYDAGFTQNYPPREYKYEIFLWGPDALTHAAQIEETLYLVETLTVEHVYAIANEKTAQ